MNPRQAFEEMKKADSALRSVNNKDWEILSFKNGDYILELNQEGLYCGMKSPIGGCTLSYAIAWKLPIYSVKRTSDGEVFTVRDDVESGSKQFKITGFVIGRYGLIVKGSFIVHSVDYLSEINHMYKLKGTDSYFSVGGHIPCAFYSQSTGWWWKFNETKQHYVLEQPDYYLLTIQDDLKMFEKGKGDYIPFYNEKQVNAFKDYLEGQK